MGHKYSTSFYKSMEENASITGIKCILTQGEYNCTNSLLQKC